MARGDMTFRIFGQDVSASKAMKDVGTAAERAGGRMKRALSNPAVVAGLAAAGVAAAKFAGDSVTAFVESEKASARLNDAYARFPKLAAGNVAAIEALAAARATSTRFDDDATKAAAAQLAAFNLSERQLKEVLPLVQDYAARTGVDLPTAAAKVGKALSGTSRGLRDVGIRLKDSKDPAVQYAAVTEALREQVGGFAEQEGKTAAGQAEILRNQFGEVQESVGSALLPVLQDLGTFLLETVIPALQKAADFVVANKDAFLAAGAAVLGLVATVKAIALAQAAWNAILAIGNGLQIAWSAITKAVAAAQWLLNAALTANPIGLVIAAIAALIAVFVLLYKNNETVRRIIDTVWEGIKSAIGAVVGWFQNTAWPLIRTVIGYIVGYYQNLWNVVKAVFNGIRTAILTAWNWIANTAVPRVRAVLDTIGGVFSKARDGIVAVWDGLTSFFSGLWNSIASGASSALSGIKGVINDYVIRPINSMIERFNSLPLPDIPTIPYLAKGGVVTRPTLAVVGEAGPEAVIPLSQAGRYGVGAGAGGPVVHVHVSGLMAGSQDGLAREIVGVIEQAYGRNAIRPQRLVMR